MLRRALAFQDEAAAALRSDTEDKEVAGFKNPGALGRR